MCNVDTVTGVRPPCFPHQVDIGRNHATSPLNANLLLLTTIVVNIAFELKAHQNLSNLAFIVCINCARAELLNIQLQKLCHKQ